ncbi:nucleoside triphosphate pyrophosphohydrolase [Papillibacter cinnamivorans]|uniref:Tetrapyrrole methylase family protein / MazG family protein n=1 Tax=Papillibacter cinnamivorans DSM 12816 TaxID=1122930 RepID=A0A1W2A314_9FIRM|nr:nucleoside triphosphate pyrophosphohydrolase [Papillibacter cinnamivorans]SMC54698.1 tetrapyrrole methylase family protein / MazG family protein [Papillibacter cinnamivorans DSM 12816]
MVNFDCKEHYKFPDLVEIIRLLRSPGGCPWDREQTHRSIRRNLLEEAYEAAEAIDTEDAGLLCEELGDVLMQVVFHARIEEEAGGFDIDAVSDGICKKLIERHPHVFGSVCVSGSDEVLVNWDQIKRKEKGQATTASAMDSVARSLPSLWRAEKIQSKAAKVGFDWPDVSGALDKLREETEELHAAAGGEGDPREELGDLLFSAVNTARFLKIDPEEALNEACEKFITRFRHVEAAAEQAGKPLSSMTLAEMDLLWDEAKQS